LPTTTTALAAVGNESAGGAKAREHVVWDRKTDGGFPETKELKRRIRDLVEPGRGLGHVDREYPKVGGGEEEGKMKRGEEGKGDSGVGGVVEGSAGTPPDGERCNDCA
jgi:Rdx family